MPKVHFVKKARKSNKRLGIVRGLPYWWWTGPKPRVHGKRGRRIVSLTPPRPSQVTSNAFMRTVLSLKESVEDAASKSSSAVIESMRSAAEELRTLAEEQASSLENMPDSLQESPTAELLWDREERCMDVADQLESAADEVEALGDEGDGKGDGEMPNDADELERIVSSINWEF